MTRLEEIQGLRHQIQEEYLKKAEEIWSSDLEVKQKDTKARKEYDKYRNKDRFLERLEGMECSVVEDLIFFYEKMR